MHFRVGVILYAIAISGITAARAQMCLEDTIRVEEVTIYSTYRQLHTIGTNTIKIDTLRLTNFEGKSLTELLQSTGVNIRSYGVGGLATIAVRGGGSSHTAVVWNGINLQSPLNGGVNLSQFPVSLFSSVSVQHGGNGTVYGSGAVSGIVILENGGLLLQQNGTRAGFTYGSGNTRGANASVKIGNSKSALSFKYSGLIADNDFEFINTYKFGNPRERITNAQAAQHGILADAVLRFGNNALWNISGWFTHNDKNVQTLMSSSQIS
ncbi:MAG: TonB-dependent receptor, partial [Bacteroidales bacterium]|nr:TonB-dependent receptor [Bacteroidales bacterium]